MKLNARGHQGKGLEIAIVASQGDVVRLEKFPAGIRFIGKGQTRPLKGPVDFIGEVCATGRAIHFDAKESGKSRGFYLTQLEEHQDQHLYRHWRAKAICGVLAYCTDTTIDAYFWISYELIRNTRIAGRACVAWPEAVRLGPSQQIINFRNIPEIAAG